jgi:hypothetical protein
MSPMVVQLVSAGSFCGRDCDAIRAGAATSAADSVCSGGEGHGALAEVAAVGDLPVVVGLDQDRSDAVVRSGTSPPVVVERQGGVGLSAVTAAGNTSRTNR